MFKFGSDASKMPMRNRKLGYFYNQLVQAWNTVFFGGLTVGGAVLTYNGHWTVGLILLLLGVGGFAFCVKQLREIFLAQEKEEKEKKEQKQQPKG